MCFADRLSDHPKHLVSFLFSNFKLTTVLRSDSSSLEHPSVSFQYGLASLCAMPDLCINQGNEFGELAYTD